MMEGIGSGHGDRERRCREGLAVFGGVGDLGLAVEKGQCADRIALEGNGECVVSHGGDPVPIGRPDLAKV